MQIARQMIDELIAHARAEAPNECCGVIGVAGGEATAFYPAVNADASPLRFTIHPSDLIRIWNETEAQGQEMGIFHSHTKSPAYPSQTDINMAREWPGSPWVIVSLAGEGEPEVRAFEIRDGQVEEVELVVE